MKQNHNIIGQIGEDIACEYLMRKGYRIALRNYQRVPFGELDVIALRDGKILFVEVKATAQTNEESLRPEEHVDQRKLVKLARTVELFLDDARAMKQLGFTERPEWDFVILVVRIDQSKKVARVTLLHDALPDPSRR